MHLSGALVTGRFTPILADARSPLLRAFRASWAGNSGPIAIGAGQETTEAQVVL